MSKLGESTIEVAGSFAAQVGSDVEDERIDLLRGALTIARTEYPNLDIESYVARIEVFAERVGSRVRDVGDPAQSIFALNTVLFGEEKLRGNREEYYDPRNSFLNDVLDRRLGIPITLALIYMEVARRIGFPLFGVGMPGHILSAKDCKERLNEIYAGQLTFQPQFLMSVSRRQMLTRILNNLKTVYLTARNFRKALPIVDMVLAIYPRSPEDVKQRALLRYSLGQMRGAVQDLEDYLKMSPDASDVDEIRDTSLNIRRTLATMN